MGFSSGFKGLKHHTISFTLGANSYMFRHPKCHLQGVYQKRRIVKSNTYFRRWTPSLASYQLTVFKFRNCRSRILSTGTVPVAPHCCNSSATQRRASSVSRPQPFIVHCAPDTGCVAASVRVHSHITRHFTYIFMHINTLSEH